MEFVDEFADVLLTKRGLDLREVIMFYLNEKLLSNEPIPVKTTDEIHAFISGDSPFLPYEVHKYRIRLLGPMVSFGRFKHVSQGIKRFEALFAIYGYLKDMKKLNKTISKKLVLGIHEFYRSERSKSLPKEICEFMANNKSYAPSSPPTDLDELLDWVEKTVENIWLNWLDTEVEKRVDQYSSVNPASSSERVLFNISVQGGSPQISPHFYDDQRNMIVSNGNTSSESLQVGNLLVKHRD